MKEAKLVQVSSVKEALALMLSGATTMEEWISTSSVSREGQGKGNWGHKGRPGEVGGSGNTDLSQADFSKKYPTLQKSTDSDIDSAAKQFYNYDVLSQSLSLDERLAINKYKASSREINKKIRNDDLSDEKTIKNLESSIDQHTLPTAVSVFRGVDAELLEPDAVGTILQDKAFVSTTISPKIAWGFSAGETDPSTSAIPTVIQIGLPAGQKGLPADNYFGRGELEILLPRNQSFIVTSDSTEYLIPGEEDSKYRLIQTELYHE